MSRAPLISLALCAPLLLAWSGGGSGRGLRGEDPGGTVTALSGLVEIDDGISLVLSGAAGDGEGLIFITLPTVLADRRISASDRAVEVAYREYGPDGTLRFAAGGARSGDLEVSLVASRVDVQLSAIWHDPRASDPHRRWTDVRVTMETDGSPAPQRGGSRGGSTYDSGSSGAGCDTTVSGGPDPEPGYYGSDDSATGCEGDDWESESSSDGWDDSSSGGCEGDDLSSDDSGGGCEGDAVGDSGGSASCEGDAVASVGARRRSPTVVRVLNQLPWLMVICGLGLRRRRRRGRA